MSRSRVSTTIGIASLLAGAAWCYLTLYLFLAMSLDNDASGIAIFFSLMFSFTFVLMAIPGVIIILNGFRLTQEVNKQNIKQCVKYLSFFTLFFFSSWILAFFSEEQQEAYSGVSLCVAILLSIPTYIYFSKALIKYEGLVPVKGEFIGKRLFLVLAWLLGLYLMSANAESTANEMGHNQITDAYWELAKFFGAILVPIAFYKIATKIFVRENADLDAAA